MSQDNPNQGSVGRAFLAEAGRRLEACRQKIEHCLSQLSDAQVWWRPRESMNSIGNMVLHLCGNLRQWIVSGIGGAPDVRDRPEEFAERGPIPKADLLSRFLAVVAEAEAVLAGADEGRLLDPRNIQGFNGTTLSAIFDSIAHLNGHTQEIVYVARLQLGVAYRFAWTPMTPEESAAAKDSVVVETVEARDAVFEQGSLAPMRPSETADEPLLPKATPGEAGSADSPLRDHLLALEQEFQDQEEEGKL